MNTCKICGREYQYERGKNHRKTVCNSCNTKIRRVRNKSKAIELLGGKCVRCGYDNPLALTFHHKNPEDKEFAITSMMNKSWSAIQAEVEKCELLCANCHIIEHTSREDVVAHIAALAQE